MFASGMDVALLHMHMGTGKTKVVLDTIAIRQHKLILVICPCSVLEVWPAEIEKHFPLGMYSSVLKGPVKRRAHFLQDILRDPAPRIAHMVLVNYQGAWREPLAKVILSVQWDCLVLDESHRIKAPAGKASRFCAKINAKHKLALTGTPLAHSPLDIYGQYRALDPGIWGTSYYLFKQHYAVLGGFERRQVVAYKNTDEFRRRLDQIRHEVKSDALDLPPKHVLDRDCVLEPRAQEMYDLMERVFEAEVEEGIVTATNALVKLLRLQQITSGFLKADEGDEPEIVSSAKAGLFRDIVEDLGEEGLVVFVKFIHDLDVCKKMLAAVRPADRIGEISGRQKDYDRWTAGEIDAVVVQVQSGIGIDLSRAHYGIYYSLGFSLADYEQCEARLHRPGQEGTTIFYRLCCQKTVDVKVLQALRERRQVVQYILEEVKRERREDDEQHDGRPWYGGGA